MPNTDNAQARKVIRICRIITIVCAVLTVALMAVLAMSNTDTWNDTAWNALRWLSRVFWVSAVIPPFVIIYVKYREREQAMEQRMQRLEAEVKQLRNE